MTAIKSSEEVRQHIRGAAAAIEEALNASGVGQRVRVIVKGRHIYLTKTVHGRILKEPDAEGGSPTED